jgi:hypothetical protein
MVEISTKTKKILDKLIDSIYFTSRKTLILKTEL